MQSLIKVLVFFDCESIRLSELSIAKTERERRIGYLTYKILI